MTETKKVWPAVVVVCVFFLLLSLIQTSVLINNQAPAVDLTNINKKLDTLANSTAIIVVNTAVKDTSTYTLSKNEFEDKAVEDKALELATESVTSKDFKKAVFNALNASTLVGAKLESYKDITEVFIKDTDVNDDKVTFEVVVKYFTDDDEDNTMKAYLKDFVVTVDELDFDDDFVDAEVDEAYLNSLVVEKVREI